MGSVTHMGERECVSGRQKKHLANADELLWFFVFLHRGRHSGELCAELVVESPVDGERSAIVAHERERARRRERQAHGERCVCERPERAAAAPPRGAGVCAERVADAQRVLEGERRAEAEQHSRDHLCSLLSAATPESSTCKAIESLSLVVQARLLP